MCATFETAIAAAQHVFADAALSDVDAELEQLTVDPWCTPTGVHPMLLPASKSGP
jgi:hypothetical protein